MTEYEYKWLPAPSASPELLRECSELYSAHYGKWSTHAPRRPGEQILLSSDMLRKWTLSSKSALYCARFNGELIGYAFAIQIMIPNYGKVSWATQLVVHEEHRNKGVGKALLFSIWTFTDHFAWGLISANPYAIRALEKATRRRCSPARIKNKHKKLIKIGLEHVPYVNPNTKIEVKKNIARIFTEFYVDLSSLPEQLRAVVDPEKPWTLGDIEEGWEWFAFTFNDQDQISLTKEEVQAMLQTSDQITRQAYSRMTLNAEHKWASYTDLEIEQVMSYCNISGGSSVADFGCGVGRHSIALAKKGVSVVGIDYVEDSIIRAQANAEEQGVRDASFLIGDCRSESLNDMFDAAICLYDVLGSYTGLEENIQILQNIRRHLKSKGRLLLSVMNFRLTELLATKWFSLPEEASKLLELSASQIMEKTGNIFDPDHFMIEKESHIVYRKEQFSQGNLLPLEVVVRDRRFTKTEIEHLCQDSGFQVLWSRPVRAGAWETSLSEDDKNAKEILLLCEKID